MSKISDPTLANLTLAKNGKLDYGDQNFVLAVTNDRAKPSSVTKKNTNGKDQKTKNGFLDLNSSKTIFNFIYTLEASLSTSHFDT